MPRKSSNKSAKKVELPAGCYVCKGAPFVSGVDLFGNHGSRRCDCARGRVLRAIDIARNNKQPQQQKLTPAASASAPHSAQTGGES